MEPTVLAIIADESTPLCESLRKFCEGLDPAVAEALIANDGEEFARRYGPQRLERVAAIVVGVFAGGRPQVVEELWPRCPNVRWIHSLAAGVDSLVPVLRPLPRIGEVQITNAKGAFSSSLAEYALMAMLHFNKQVPRIQANKRAKLWEKFEMGELRGLTVGFVGFGDIAQTTARLCQAFGMRILALRRQAAGAPPGKAEADETLTIGDPEQRLAIFRRSDFVVCSLPGTPETRHFCGRKEFDAMKPSGIFISVGRGSCVDEAALCQALSSGSIAGAALDVFETEPLPKDALVWEAPNTLITSHNADLVKSYTEDAWGIFTARLAEFRSGPEAFRGTVSLEYGY